MSIRLTGQRFVVATLVLISTVVARPLPAADESCLVSTTGGAVQGVDAGSTCAFLGVPYGAAPTGERRWKPPVPAPAWAGVLPVTTPPPTCAMVQLNGSLAGNEDCLRLNIWTPNPLPAAPAPVIVWLHPGGFTSASANLASHNGRRLAEETGVIVVAPNYRLGPFGFLVHEALAAEDPDHPVSGNYGLLDQRAALTWVRGEIAAFGGDPTRVTVGGTSAGGDSAGLHLVMPESDGLFQRAMVHSGTPILRWPTHAETLSQGEAFATALGCLDPSQVLSCMRSKTRNEILLALPFASQQVAESAGRVYWSPVVDGVEIPDQPRWLFETGRFARVPVLVGVTRDEAAGSFVSRSFPAGVSLAQYQAWIDTEFGQDSASVAAVYPASDYALPGDAMARVVTDGQFTCEARRLARLVDAVGQPVFFFSYDYVIDDLSPDRVIHGVEANMLFGNDYTPAAFPNHPLDDADRALHRAMAGYWTRFAATGNPNLEGTGAVHWPAFTDPFGQGRGSNKFILLDTVIQDDKRPTETLCDFWEPFFLRTMLGVTPAGSF